MQDWLKELVTQAAEDLGIDLPPNLDEEINKDKPKEPNEFKDVIPPGKIITYKGEKWRVLTHLRTYPISYMIENLKREIAIVEIEARKRQDSQISSKLDSEKIMIQDD